MTKDDKDALSLALRQIISEAKSLNQLLPANCENLAAIRANFNQAAMRLVNTLTQKGEREAAANMALALENRLATLSTAIDELLLSGHNLPANIFTLVAQLYANTDIIRTICCPEPLESVA